MMRIAPFTFTALVLSAGMSSAQYVGPSETAPGETIGYSTSTVASILAAPKDDMKVTLEGKLIRKVEDETYIFSDGTGEIAVEIDDEDFPNQPVDANTTVRIEGEVDTHLLKDTDIDAERVIVMQ